MSEFTETIADIVQDRASSTTDPVLNLTTGKTFTAEIEDVTDPVILMTELGEDAREATILHVTGDADAAAISQGDQVRFTLYGASVTMRVVRRKNNPASPQADFWCSKILTGKDT